eukprot:827015-Pelagomonas_calceolata.AAC.3
MDWLRHNRQCCAPPSLIPTHALLQRSCYRSFGDEHAWVELGMRGNAGVQPRLFPSVLLCSALSSTSGRSS